MKDIEGKINEKNFSTQQSPSEESTRFQEKDEHSRREEGLEPEKDEGEKKADRLISDVRGKVDRSFRKEERLIKNSDFQRVYAEGSRYSNEDFILYVHRAQEGRGRRLGISVSRRLGGAVVRNRIKRLVREAYRERKGRLAENMDIVVVPRKTNTVLSYSRVKRALESLFRKSGLDRAVEPRDDRWN
jgi:ribonuclease P protein component